ncbi:hypothetical protein ACIRQY_15320 [Streptomyces sp. NPDC101490]
MAATAGPTGRAGGVEGTAVRVLDRLSAALDAAGADLRTERAGGPGAVPE